MKSELLPDPNWYWSGGIFDIAASLTLDARSIDWPRGAVRYVDQSRASEGYRGLLSID